MVKGFGSQSAFLPSLHLLSISRCPAWTDRILRPGTPWAIDPLSDLSLRDCSALVSASVRVSVLDSIMGVGMPLPAEAAHARSVAERMPGPSWQIWGYPCQEAGKCEMPLARTGARSVQPCCLGQGRGWSWAAGKGLGSDVQLLPACSPTPLQPAVCPSAVGLPA